MKAQVCVRSVGQGGASMQQLCEHVKRVLICLQRNKNLWVWQKDNKPIPWKGRIICSDHSKLFNFPCPASILRTVQLLQLLKATVLQMSNWAPTHVCAVCIVCWLQLPDSMWICTSYHNSLFWFRNGMYPHKIQKQTKLIQTDGNTHICAYLPPSAPSSSSSKTLNASRILRGEAYIRYWCRVKTSPSHESFDKSSPWQKLLNL